MAWASQNIFAGRTTFDFYPNVAILFHHGTKFMAILFYSIMRLRYGPRRIFLPASLNLTFVQVKRKKLAPQIGHLEKHLRNGWRKRQVTLVVAHKARP